MLTVVGAGGLNISRWQDFSSDITCQRGYQTADIITWPTSKSNADALEQWIKDYYASNDFNAEDQGEGQGGAYGIPSTYSPTSPQAPGSTGGPQEGL